MKTIKKARRDYRWASPFPSSRRDGDKTYLLTKLIIIRLRHPHGLLSLQTLKK